ncbi:MAG: hypothetical protein QXE31_04400 [Candidatus Woesearchaeota archaeon]
MDTITLELINSIFLDTKSYREIMKFAEVDSLKKNIEDIANFLSSLDKKNQQKIYFDPSKSDDSSFNDVLDSFVRIKDQNFLNTLDKWTLDQLLILFNKWISTKNLSNNPLGLNNIVFDFSNVNSNLTEVIEKEFFSSFSRSVSNEETQEFKHRNNENFEVLYSLKSNSFNYNLNEFYQDFVLNAEFLIDFKNVSDNPYNTKALYKIL